MRITNLSIITIVVVLLTLIGCGNSNNQDNKTVAENDSLTKEITIEEETVDINGIKHYIKKIGSGEPIIVLHDGPGMFHDYLVPHFEKLANDYQIIFYDQRGCGKTEFPQDTSTITTANFVEDLEGIRNHLKIEKLILAGHSWGAALAISYGKKYPEHLNKLILISPAPATSEYFDQTFKNMQHKRTDEDTKELVKLMSSKEFEQREPSAFLKAISIGDKVNLAKQETIDELYKPMTFTPANANNLLLVNSIMEKNFFDYDITKGIDVIDCPTLIIVGDMDNVPFASNQILQESLNARIEVLKPACHYPFFETPKEFNRAVKSFISPEYE
ncbi:MAG: alpha/beta fold hydrolase [Flavobacteriales bacterium]|nr:alpha/beta fold hydrolase [Flavobacteriales bacterium]